MLQYISGILSKFTQKQRITALILLLISIVIITLVPKWISTLSPDTKESQLILKQQDTHIKNLSNQIDTCNLKITKLNKQIIQNQQECTDNIIKREQEIWKEIDALENQMKIKQIIKSTPKKVKLDSCEPHVELKMVIQNEPPIQVVNNDNSLIINLEKLKKKVIKH
jgi:TolA-binding protein